ncbi:hypothetical protein [Geothrix campi]|uniref:hypothetical protein n=1 Tax=Geothrix campi TaxID=2966450 RepID=UPI0021488036|nr:hypothetical protein [Geothrix sp. SG10]
MNTTLSFRKESIQRSSNASEAASQPVGFTESQGSKHARDRWYPTLTTSLTTI